MVSSKDAEPVLWRAYVADAQTLDPEAFAVRHPHPVLVLVGVDPTVDVSEADRFKTVSQQSRGLSQAIRAKAASIKPPEDEEPAPVRRGAVFEVKKRAGNAYPDRVSLGRTRTNDVTLGFPLISKFHAYIQSSNQKFSISDAGTTNGTRVNGQTLVANIVTPLPDNAVVKIGPYRMQFMLPGSFRQWLLNPDATGHLS